MDFSLKETEYYTCSYIDRCQPEIVRQHTSNQTAKLTGATDRVWLTRRKVLPRRTFNARKIDTHIFKKNALLQ